MPLMKTPDHYLHSPLVGAPTRKRSWLAFHRGRVGRATGGLSELLLRVPGLRPGSPWGSGASAKAYCFYEGTLGRLPITTLTIQRCSQCDPLPLANVQVQQATLAYSSQ